MKKITLRIGFLFVFIATLLALAACSVTELPSFDYSEKLRVFSGAMGKSVEIDDEETIRIITDAANALEETPKSREKIDGYSFELTWLDEDGKSLGSLIIYGADEIGCNGWIYEADCGELLYILSGVPMPLKE